MADTNTDTPDVAANFKNTDPIYQNDWQGPTLDQLQTTDSPSWSGDYYWKDENSYSPDYVFPSPLSLPDAPVSDAITTGFENRPFHDQYTEYPGLFELAGRPSRGYTFADVNNFLTASTVLTRQLMLGSGVIYGFTAFSVATAVTPFSVLTDSLDGNGPVIAVIANNVVQTGYTPLGVHGLEFRNGLTLANLTTATGTPGAQLALIPIIARRHVLAHKPDN